MAAAPVVTAPRVMRPVSRDRVASAEARLRFRFPAGYADFMERHGAAFYSNDVRVLSPETVVTENEEWRLGEGKYFFWTEPDSALPRERARECVRFVNTIFGDVVAVHPSIPNACFLFPRSSERIHRFDGDFDDMLEWLLTSGICLAPSRTRYVEPLVDAPAWGATSDFAPAEVIARLAAMDGAASIFRDVVGQERRVEIFLPKYEARIRLDESEADDCRDIEIISFLDPGAPLESLRRELAERGIEEA